MRIWIKAHKQASLMLFRRGNDADYERVDRIDAYNRGIAERVFNGIMNHDFDYAYIKHSYGTQIFTRSTRGNYIQVSRLALDGIFNGHTDVETVEKLERELICGNYITIKKI